MINYSDEALKARPTFFAPYNDVTIIVEDLGKENFYTEILRRLLNRNLKISQVLGVGGKSQVLKRLEERADLHQSKPEFYLVDGDFDGLLGRDMPNSIYLYSLRRYDIESYLLEDPAICTIASEEKPNLTADECSNSLKVASWLAEAVESSLRLSACAALLQQLEETETGISQAIERYVEGSEALPDRYKIESHIQQVKMAQSRVTPEEFDSLLEEMVRRMGETTSDRIRWVSGKDILVPLAIRLLRLSVGSSLKKETLCIRLAKVCEFHELYELRDRILAVV